MSKKEKKEDIPTEEMNENTQEVVDEQSSEENSKKDGKEEKSELEIMTDKYKEMNDKYLRLYSEFDNFRKRTQKEKLELFKTAGEEVISSLLPVMDDFERALKAMEGAEDVKSVKDGIELIHNKLQKTMQQQGLKAIDSSIGKIFDIELHEAIANVPAPDKSMKGKIIDETEKGYLLNDKVIRYTKVVIGE